MTLPIENLCVLLVEDDPIIGLDLRNTLEAAGAVVIGPAHDLVGALALLERAPVDVCVLDHLIIGGDSLPFADLLVQRRIAFLFHTSHRADLHKRFPAVPIIDKPSRPDELVKSLQALAVKRPEIAAQPGG